MRGDCVCKRMYKYTRDWRDEELGDRKRFGLGLGVGDGEESEMDSEMDGVWMWVKILQAMGHLVHVSKGVMWYLRFLKC